MSSVSLNFSHSMNETVCLFVCLCAVQLSMDLAGDTLEVFIQLMTTYE